jgi:hypothetical protein
MSRSRPYANLTGPELLDKLFDAAFAAEATPFEDLLYELDGDDDNYAGRSKLRNIRPVLVKVANRIFDSGMIEI